MDQSLVYPSTWMLQSGGACCNARYRQPRQWKLTHSIARQINFQGQHCSSSELNCWLLTWQFFTLSTQQQGKIIQPWHLFKKTIATMQISLAVWSNAETARGMMTYHGYPCLAHLAMHCTAQRTASFEPRHHPKGENRYILNDSNIWSISKPKSSQWYEMGSMNTCDGPQCDWWKQNIQHTMSFTSQIGCNYQMVDLLKSKCKRSGTIITVDS